jgi:aryl-alcohol dehydrogenase-like predicted oxidoreductase
MGSLTVSAMQANLPEDEAAAVLAYAFDSGINFVDTAQYYENYHLIRKAFTKCRSPEKVMLSTKTYACFVIVPYFSYLLIPLKHLEA